MKLYVGNLPYSVNDDELRQMFEPHGNVTSASVVIDRETGRSRGFGFVEMSDDNEARNAIEAMHGQEMAGRNLTVNEARPKAPRSGGFGGGGGYGGGGGGYGGGGGRGGYGGGRGDRGDRGDRGYGGGRGDRGDRQGGGW